MMALRSVAHDQAREWFASAGESGNGPDEQVHVFLGDEASDEDRIDVFAGPESFSYQFSVEAIRNHTYAFGDPKFTVYPLSRRGGDGDDVIRHTGCQALYTPADPPELAQVLFPVLFAPDFVPGRDKWLSSDRRYCPAGEE
jgi:hypothetical protein